MITNQNYKPPLSAPAKYWVFCDDSYFIWNKPPTEAVLDKWKWPDDGGMSRVEIKSNWSLGHRSSTSTKWVYRIRLLELYGRHKKTSILQNLSRF